MTTESLADRPAPARVPTAAPTATPMPTRVGGRERLALVVLLTASFTLAVDFSILNVALPRIGGDVGFSLANLQWISTTFAVCAAGFTLSFGRIADLFGRRRLFLAGIAVLGVSSLAGGLATVPWVLLTARVAQGLATAAVTPAALSLLTTSFPEGPLRERVLGLNGALMASGFTAGAILGGLLTDLVSWRWAFFINVIVAVVVLSVGPAVLTENKAADPPRLDVPGAVTVTAALVTGVYGLTQAGERSWSDPHCWGFLAAAAILLAVFAVVERSVAAPLVPPSILARPSVRWGNLAGLLAFATETSVVFLLTLYLQKVRDYTPLQSGLAFAVLGLGTVVGGLLGPRVIARLGGRLAVVLGFVAQCAATVPLVFLGDAPGWLADLLAATFVGGVANLVAIVGFMVTATSGLAGGEQGLATGLATMSQQVGIALGTPVMSAIATASGADTPHGILHGVTTALAVNAALCLAAAILLAITLPTDALPTDALPTDALPTDRRHSESAA
nr:MFS transporter [Parafrankia sp. EUN1f]